MPRFSTGPSENSDSGELIIKSQSPGCVEVFYTPSESRLQRSGLASDKARNAKQSC